MIHPRIRPQYRKANYLFFFKQKTAYEIMPSLVGSEMCIRDRILVRSQKQSTFVQIKTQASGAKSDAEVVLGSLVCLLV